MMVPSTCAIQAGMPIPKSNAPTIAQAFEGARLADARLNRRLMSIAQTLAERPDESFAEVFKDASQLEGLYRFVNHPRVTASDMIAPHCRQPVARAAEHDTVWVAHDTTFCTFDGQGRVGLGPLTHKGGARGFLAHVALAMAPTEQVVAPLGVGPPGWLTLGRGFETLRAYEAGWCAREAQM